MQTKNIITISATDWIIPLRQMTDYKYHINQFYFDRIMSLVNLIHKWYRLHNFKTIEGIFTDVGTSIIY